MLIETQKDIRDYIKHLINRQIAQFERLNEARKIQHLKPRKRITEYKKVLEKQNKTTNDLNNEVRKLSTPRNDKLLTSKGRCLNGYT